MGAVLERQPVNDDWLPFCVMLLLGKQKQNAEERPTNEEAQASLHAPIPSLDDVDMPAYALPSAATDEKPRRNISDWAKRLRHMRREIRYTLVKGTLYCFVTVTEMFRT